jgi:hypothetical protein
MTGPLTSSLATAQRALTAYTKRVLSLEEEIVDIGWEQEQPIAARSPVLRALIGVGMDTSAVLLR